ncbi:MAG: glucosidase [Elusimicrobia bacterium]|nr:glucosidase [Elusimicrobiota bacterium]
MNAEQLRLQEVREGKAAWRKWGPYLSERQWGTVREDYSESGDAWNYFSHDQARSRAYRWGEDGLGGISDDHQRLCFALALWNGKDPIIKERLFGLTNSEGNHGEDVKEYYFYLDSTPTHSYMKYLYKYPQRAYPYDDLVRTNKARSRDQREYELLDTGIFDGNRYFDVYLEYAKASDEDILVQISAVNRGPESADLHILPTLWFRNDWAGWIDRPSAKPALRQVKGPSGVCHVETTHPDLGNHHLYVEGTVPLLFSDNETNNAKLFPQYPNPSPYVKDGINDYIVQGKKQAVNPAGTGTKVSSHHKVSLAPGATATVRVRLSLKTMEKPFADFESILNSRKAEADDFFKGVTPSTVSPDAAAVLRQAVAGMLWSKQYYYFDGNKWLKEHGAHPLIPGNRLSRNREWFHMINEDIISMPDKWEYPWYAAWDLAFHTLPIALVDPDFAKQQMQLMFNGFYIHPTGQIPAYEWNFSDVNPPVHAWATLFLHRTELSLRGEPDRKFLESAFKKLLLNFAWWINRKDRSGKNVFEGGFLGLDNIGLFDRSSPLPTGGHLEQADGTAWMALFSQNMLELAVELAGEDPNYQEMVSKFAEHFLYIAKGINKSGADGMWDEADGFYYDVLQLPSGEAVRLKVRSMVGLLPLCAATVMEGWQRDRVPQALKDLETRRRQMPELFEHMHPTGPGKMGVNDRGIIALVDPERLRRILSKMLDENEFLSPHGIRSLSKFHKNNPYIFNVNGQEFRVDYLPGESNSGMFGGNSNWRGPVWMPVNVLLIRALLQFYLYHGDTLKVECPTGSGRWMNLFEVAQDLANRLNGIFLKDRQGKRPVYGSIEKFQTDPHWRDHVLFYEYFDGETGEGIGASHQTGWTGLAAKLIQLFGVLDAKSFLESGKRGAFTNSK